MYVECQPVPVLYQVHFMRPFDINKSTIELVTHICHFIRLTLCEAMQCTEIDVFVVTLYTDSVELLAKVSVQPM